MKALGAGARGGGGGEGSTEPTLDGQPPPQHEFLGLPALSKVQASLSP